MNTRTAHRFPRMPLVIPALLLLPLIVALSAECSSGAALSMDVRPENTTVLHNSDGTSNIRIRIMGQFIQHTGRNIFKPCHHATNVFIRILRQFHKGFFISGDIGCYGNLHLCNRIDG